MSDHSAIQNVVKLSEIDCNLLFANAECSSTTTARLVTPRKPLQVVPTLDPAIGVAAIRDHLQKEVCHGNARAAKLLQRLIFRYLPEENGKARLRTYRYNSFWWEKSHEDWAEETGTTVKQVRTDFAKLKEWGLAEARPMKVYEGKNAGKTVTHSRVFAADGAASLSGWPDYSQMRIILGCPNGHPIASPKWASHSIAQMGIHKAKGVVQKEKIKQESKANSASVKALTKDGTPSKASKASKADGKLSWVTEWEKPIDGTTPTPLKPEQVGMLKNVGTEMGKHGFYLGDLITYLKSSLNWLRFTERTSKDVDVKTTPTLSDDWAVEFFAKYWVIALNQMLKHPEYKASLKALFDPQIDAWIDKATLDAISAAKDAAYAEVKEAKKAQAKINAAAEKIAALQTKIDQAVVLLAYDGVVVDPATLSLEPADSDGFMLKTIKERLLELKALQPEPVIVATATPPAPIEMSAHTSTSSQAVVGLVVTPKPDIVPTLEDADCLGLDPEQSVIPWTAEQGKAWFAEQAKKAAEATAAMQVKKAAPKGPAKPFHLFNVA
jgi:hypothetical protein